LRHSTRFRRALFLIFAAQPCPAEAVALGVNDLLTLDDRSSGTTEALNGNAWRLFTDGVMGGISLGQLTTGSIAGRACLRMQGEVCLENNGGFVQIALDVGDAIQRALPDYAGIELDVFGNGERYNLHLRTEDMQHPWQSYRASFTAASEWRTLRLPFHEFEPHRLDSPLQPARIRRIGLVAIGRAFQADLCLGRLAFYQ
jgi:hypothetical protein